MDNSKHYIFADESSTDKLRFMILGGIWVDKPTYQAVVDECKNFKLTNGWSENTKFNWKNISKKTFDGYCQFIDIFFKYNLQFNCIIIDRKKIDLKANKNNDPELGFYKFYYQLLRHNSLKDVQYYIYLDRRNNREPSRLEALKSFLRRDTHSQGKLDIGLNVKTLEFVNSNSYDLIQFSDLLMGAIGFQYNNHHIKPDASQNKIKFANYIASKIQKPNLIFSTDKQGYKNLNLWLFKSNKNTLIK